MQKIRLNRFDYGEDATFGIIDLPNGDCLYTLELPWKGNTPFVSCIPEGKYLCIPDMHNNRPSWLLCDVPGRDLVKIHAANLPDELEGCIAPGMKMGRMYGRRAVISSRLAMAKLEFWFKNEPFELEIIYKDGL